jgi:hypothetical protein
MNTFSRSGHVIGKRFGLGRDAVFRLWKAAIKDDEGLLDEAIAQTYERMLRIHQGEARRRAATLRKRMRSIATPPYRGKFALERS